MCGIAGLLDARAPVQQAVLDAFTDSLAHRGPDGRGTHVDGNLGLGHRRLAILDLSDAGRNPMAIETPDGRRLWITYNGEVYNFLELRAELERDGYRFRSASDTEVVAAAIARWGEDALPRFNGMWALAMWDETSRTLFLARDRFGIKPLYYAVQPARFAFASELKAFTALAGFTPAIDDGVVPDLVRSSYAYEGSRAETIMAGVHRLPAGHCLTVRAGEAPKVRRWWDTMANLPEIPASWEDRVERFRELFMDAVRLRQRSDVRIGTSLSGGLDSSAVACALHHQAAAGGGDRRTDDWRHAFVATFPGTALDERHHAETVIRQIGAEGHYLVFDPDEALAAVPQSVWAMEDVYGGLATPVWMNYREMRRAGVVVSLDGHGCDELLGGYAWYLNQPRNKLNEALNRDFHTTLLPAILRNYDRCSMAHGIEVRMPFMDWRVVTYAFALPGEAKLGGGFTKRVLRDAMRGILPESIRVRRSKIGFNSPMIDWFNGGFVRLMEQVTSHPLWLENRHWDGPGLRRDILGRSRAGAWTRDDWGYSLHVWTLMNIVVWHMLFVDGRRPESLWG